MSTIRYFINCKFVEGKKELSLFNIKKKGKNVIDPISIGIKSEDGREYYAISKDFDLKRAWYRYELDNTSCLDVSSNRDFYIRENILKLIFIDLTVKESKEKEDLGFSNIYNYKNLKRLIKKYGKSNKEISEEIKEFVYNQTDYQLYCGEYHKPIFYSFYSDYTWITFYNFFGGYNNLPFLFPVYCISLKQELDNLGDLKEVKKDKRYPKRKNKHDALNNAKWNFELYNFIKNYEN